MVQTAKAALCIHMEFYNGQWCGELSDRSQSPFSGETVRVLQLGQCRMRCQQAFDCCRSRNSDLLKLQQGVVQAANVVVHYGLGAKFVVEVGKGHLRHGAATQGQQGGVFLAHESSLYSPVHSDTETILLTGC